jgi:hypothetical protein
MFFGGPRGIFFRTNTYLRNRIFSRAKNSIVNMDVDIAVTCGLSSAVQSVRVNESTYRNEQHSNDSSVRNGCTQGLTNSPACHKRNAASAMNFLSKA